MWSKCLEAHFVQLKTYYPGSYFWNLISLSGFTGFHGRNNLIPGLVKNKNILRPWPNTQKKCIDHKHKVLWFRIIAFILDSEFCYFLEKYQYMHKNTKITWFDKNTKTVIRSVYQPPDPSPSGQFTPPPHPPRPRWIYPWLTKILIYLKIQLWDLPIIKWVERIF